MDAQSITQIHPRGLSLFDPFPIRPSFFSFTLRRTLRQFFRLEFLFRPTISLNLQEMPGFDADAYLQTVNHH